ncbi:MAG: hypothetical protein ACXU8A_09725 [Burkholderiaceae bacterium]
MTTLRKQSSKPNTSTAAEVFVSKFKAQSDSIRLQAIADGTLISASDLSERMHITKLAISKATVSNRIFAVSAPTGELYYPAFFAEEEIDRRNLEKVCKILGDLPGGSKLQFFMTPKTSLGGKTPLEALRKGHVDDVLVSAAGFVSI